VTADHFAGAAGDEIADPRPVAELLRQWSTDHPEFQSLPRKFKIAVSGAENDRAVLRAHDVAVQVVEQNGKRGYRIFVGGGLGRTPMIGKVLRDFLSVWNLLGRRDNKYKARIKITVHEHGIEEISRLVEERFAQIAPTFGGVDQQMLKEIEAHFAAPAYATGSIAAYDAYRAANPAFRSWSDTNLAEHKNADYAIVSISLKAHGATPGDASSDQMRVMADLAEKFAHDELRISHERHRTLDPCRARDCDPL